MGARLAGLLLTGLRKLASIGARLWARFRRFWLWVLVFWAAAFAVNWAMLAHRYRDFLNDTDDALRLVQWRLFRDGAGWHDLLIARMGAPEGLESHWSRLVDAGLLLLYWPLGLFMPPDEAETMMRLIWPLLLLLPLLAAVAMIARSAGGRKAVIPALLLATLSLPAQFTPGRIDHHNAQVVLLMLSWAFMFAGFRRHMMMIPAGFMVAMTMAVGLEALPYLVFVPAAVALAWALGRLETGKPLMLFGAGLAAGSLLMLLSALPPSRLLHTACDAYAANWALPLLTAGTGLALLPLVPASWLATTSRRLAAVALPAVVAAAVFVAMDPQCLQGPFAGMPETVRRAWLAHVKEMQPITDVMAKPRAMLMWMTLIVWSAFVLLPWFLSSRRRENGPSLAEVMLALAVMTALAIGMRHIRLLAYAQWLALPLLAVALARLLPGQSRLHGGLRTGTALFLSPVSALAAALIALQHIGPVSQEASPDHEEKADLTACQKDEALKPLADLPPGFLAGDLGLQTFILARTPHRVLAGPYHRIADRIETNYRLLSDPHEKARLRALTLGLDYIAVCPGARIYALDGEPAGPDSLWQHLLRGEVPEWLEPVRLSAPTPIRIYRVRANRPLPAVIDVPKELLEGIKPGTDTPRLRQTLHE